MPRGERAVWRKAGFEPGARDARRGRETEALVRMFKERTERAKTAAEEMAAHADGDGFETS